MHFARSGRFHRFTSSCVVALLTANAFAIALIATDNPLSTAESPAHTLTLITTSDGHRILADPNTPAGRAAIEEAKHNGSTLQNVPVPTTSSTALASRKSGSTLPTLPPVNGVLPIDPGSALDQTINNIFNTFNDTKSTVDSVVRDTESTVDSIVKDTESTLDSVVKDTESTVNSVLNDTESTVNSVVTEVSTSLAPILNPVQTTVATVLNQVTGTLSTQATTTTTVKSPVCVLAIC